MNRLGIVLSLGWLIWAEAWAVPKFLGPGEIHSDAGHLTLSWQEDLTRSDIPIFLLERSAADGIWEPEYQGPDRSRFISGLADGTYRFRLREAEGPWSEPIKLTVAHFDRSLAWGLFAAGGLTFLAICLVIWQGNRRCEAS